MESTFVEYTQSGEEEQTMDNICGNSVIGGAGRRKREFISDEKKDASYWEKRRKNNEAAKRSREKRRFHDLVLEGKVAALDEENGRLRNELLQLKLRFGLISAASLLEMRQALGNHKVTETGTILCTGGNVDYSSSYLGLNSDSSEADSGGGAAMGNYSPRGSLSDLSDQSSRDSPGPNSYSEGRAMDNDFSHLHSTDGVGPERLAAPRGGVILYRIGGLTVDPQQNHRQVSNLTGVMAHCTQGPECSSPPPRSSIFMNTESSQTSFKHLVKAADIGITGGSTSPKSLTSSYQSEDSGSEEGGSNYCSQEFPQQQDLSSGVKLPHKLRLKCRAHGQDVWGANRGQGFEVLDCLTERL
ncbi:nuclear factor interleukin-3-regulated protein-like [Bombina bombina]|uniref:nuclear factor interleukin-3-regulated protein-like n=1 Tax=Bombina bombina TaxID=8345 RepID=UPI00235A874C|nr:nuclear factor interleukin-3-regulated protein-like [Bombina bombina]